MPCIFENFIWFKDQEIINEVRKDWPSFDGTAPDAVATIQKIRLALERMLKTKNLPAEVEYFNFADRGEHIFTVKNARLTVCKVVVTGTATVPQGELLQSTQPLINSDYSRLNARTQAEIEVSKVYGKYGYLQAKFTLPSGEFGSDADTACKSRVIVTIPVVPGIAYLWDKAIWTGNQVIPTQTLDTVLAMKTGEVANGQKIDAGLRNVFNTYGKQGYVTVQLVPTPEFNDAAKRVTFKINIAEGQQFRMGNLTVLGLSETVAQQLRAQWKLKTGDVYDATYLSEFLNKAVEGGTIRLDPSKKFKADLKPDRQKLVVEVILNFNAPRQ